VSSSAFWAVIFPHLRIAELRKEGVHDFAEEQDKRNFTEKGVVCGQGFLVRYCRRRHSKRWR
jgi:hypothetical protein